VAKLEQLSTSDPQMAWNLLSGCLLFAVGYHMAVTPPRIAVDAMATWDQAISDARIRILSNPRFGRAPLMGADLRRLVDAKAALPRKTHGGCGHTRAAAVWPIAYYMSYAQHVHLDKPDRRHRLQAELTDCKRLCKDSMSEMDFERLLSTDVQKVGEAAPAKNMRRLMVFAVHAQASSVLSRMPMTAYDRRAIAAGNDAWRAFSALPTCDELTMEGHDFTAALRFHLLLPQLLRLAEDPVVLDRDLDLPRLLRPEDVSAPRPSPPDLS
jgi:hypothetical protein